MGRLGLQAVGEGITRLRLGAVLLSLVVNARKGSEGGDGGC